MTQTPIGRRHEIEAADLFAQWLRAFAASVEQAEPDRISAFFAADGTWRDVLSFTWGYRTFEGRPAIEAALRQTLAPTKPTRVRLADGRSPAKWVRRAGADTVEGFFDFETAAGPGTGFVQLLPDEERPAASTIRIGLTSQQGLADYPEQVGANRPTGLHWSYTFAGDNWKDERIGALDLARRAPEVLVVGAGQSGLALAARLRVLGVDAIVVEANPRVGDNWRNRYHSLTLHNESWVNHLPYMPFPDSWPAYVPKDKIAEWLEYYAEAMEIDVFTSTRFVSADRDQAGGSWEVILSGKNDETIRLSVPHIAWATGAVSGTPYMPAMPGLENYRGEVIHSSAFLGGPGYAGRRAVVLGTGNSGHDVAQDLYCNGAKSVSLVQRGPTTVVSLTPSSALVYSAFAERPTEDADLFVLTTPYRVMRDGYQRMVRRTRELDAELLKGLEAVGFRTDEGADDTGWHMKYLRRGGGYYINVGASQLVANGSIALLNASQIEGFTQSGLHLADGTQLEADLVVFATGFESQASTIARAFGAEVSRRVGQIWDIDDEGYMNGMWRKTGQEGFWIMGGSLLEARIWSRFLALQLVAALRGIEATR
jgi:cation diffusion facilitator CzcD-associated flavoprotein CzcO